MAFKINNQEREKLYELPYMQQLLYVMALRPYMDYATGIVGIKRGISYQSLTEELSVAAHQGYQAFKPSRQQIRRAIQGLIRVGLLEQQPAEKKLIFKCLEASRDRSLQNKVGTKPIPKQSSSRHGETLKNQGLRR